MSPRICERCQTSNTGAFCSNRHCGGEPVSRTVDAVSPAVIDPRRQCRTRYGIAKIGYRTFDEAQDIAATMRDRVHVYRCLEHGWHVGSNRDGAAVNDMLAKEIGKVVMITADLDPDDNTKLLWLDCELVPESYPGTPMEQRP